MPAQTFDAIRSEFGRILQIRRVIQGLCIRPLVYIHVRVFEVALRYRRVWWRGHSRWITMEVCTECTLLPSQSPPSRRRRRWWYSGPVISRRLTIREQSCYCCSEHRITVLSDSLSDGKKKRKKKPRRKNKREEIRISRFEDRKRRIFAGSSLIATRLIRFYPA